MKVINNIDKVFKQITGRAEIALKAAAIHAESAVTAVTPVDHGNLRRSNSHRIEKQDGQVVAKVGNSAEYAPFVHNGTGEFAKNGKGRSGGWSYKDEEGKWQHTMGNKPQPFIQKTLRRESANIQTIIAKNMKG